jgi:flagellar L-ring protein precursor FlgH
VSAVTRLAAIAVATLGLAGCGALYPHVEMPVPTAPAVPAPAPAPQPANGAIFDAARYRPLFEDYRARLPGDTLVVSISEKVSASQKSTSSIDKSSAINGTIKALPGVNATKILGRASVDASTANTFAGKGATENSNDFSGTITVTVRDVLPNGHLLIAGEKQIGVNANVDVLRFSGQVDPRAIQPGNSVQSTQIANVRLEHRGRGAQADAQAVGWLQRVFLSVVSPL